MRNKFGQIVISIFIIIFSSQYVAFAKDNISGLKKEIDELKQEQKRLREDMRMIKNLLLQDQGANRRPTLTEGIVHDVEFELGDNPEKGYKSAPLVLVEFSDYQCSFCAKHTRQTYPLIHDLYIDTGKLRYVFVDKPLPNHDMAFDAANAAHCAADQGKFQEIHKKMMDSPNTLNDLNSLALSLSLDIQKFNSCMTEKKYSKKIASNLSLAKKLNVLGVPGFVIASSDPDNPQKVKGISYIRGAMPFAAFEREIEQALENLSD